MRRRDWLAGIGVASLSAVSGCLESVPAGGDDAGDRDDGNDRNGSEFVAHPDGDAEVTVRVEQVSGFGEPEAYEIALEIASVELSRAGEEGGVRYDADETVALQNEPGAFPDLEATLVERTEIPVGTYDYFRFYGSVVDVSGADGDVGLSDGDRIERAVGAVFEVDDHKEHVLQLAVHERDGGYELTDAGMKTVTW